MIKGKVYLGDGLYARDDGYHIWLTAENGISVQHEVALDPDVLRVFMSFVERTRNLKITVERVDPEKQEVSS